jgi:hypothetical protein
MHRLQTVAITATLVYLVTDGSWPTAEVSLTIDAVR